MKENNFQENIANSFHILREDPDFSDVTLVCEEEIQVEAHRVILSACSPIFNSMLKGKKHSHPMIFMRGLKFNNLVAVLDFIYHGEANIYQEDLDGFLAIAEELQLKGLSGSTDKKQQETEQYKAVPVVRQKKKALPKDEVLPYPLDLNQHIKETFKEIKESYINDCPVVDSSKFMVPYDSSNEENELKIASMMESITEEGFNYRCTVCGKPGKDKQATRRHVESHIEGASHPCNLCGKVSSSSNGLHAHVSKYHRK